MEEAVTDAASQAWLEGWPIVRTRVALAQPEQALGPMGRAELELRNEGHADAQILEIEGLGDASRVNIGLDHVYTVHTAGVQLERGGVRTNIGDFGTLRSALPIPSELAPGEGFKRGLNVDRPPVPTEATVIIRGNFPEVRLVLRFGG